MPVRGSPRHSPQWTLYPGGVTSTLLLDSSLAKSSVTNDRSEVRVDPLAALLYKVKQANIKQRYRGQRRKGRVEIRGRAMGQGRRQTERITIKQARSERQAANDQERRSTVQVVHRKTNWENRSEM